MKKVDIILFVEHKDREFAVASEIAKELKRTGYKVVILSTVFHSFLSVFRYKPKMIMTPSSCFGKGSVASLFYDVYGNSIEYININYEQFISSWKGDYKKSKNPVSLNYQLQLVWGEYFKGVLEKQGYKNIAVTGKPSLSLLNEAPSNGSSSISMIFVALTDGLMFIGEEKIKFIIEQGGKKEELLAHVDYVKKNVTELFNQIYAFAKANPLIDIVLRPHPSISKEKYVKFLYSDRDDLSNIKINKDFDALYWLEKCDIYVTNYSTLCIEAIKMKKATFIFESFASDNMEDFWYTKPFEVISNFEDVLRKGLSPPVNLPENTNTFIDFRLDGIKETVKVVDQQIQSNVIAPNSSFMSMLSLPLAYPRRFVGFIIRNLYIKFSFLPVDSLSKGLLPDYFKKDKVNHD